MKCGLRKVETLWLNDEFMLPIKEGSRIRFVYLVNEINCEIVSFQRSSLYFLCGLFGFGYIF